MILAPAKGTGGHNPPFVGIGGLGFAVSNVGVIVFIWVGAQPWLGNPPMACIAVCATDNVCFAAFGFQAAEYRVRQTRSVKVNKAYAKVLFV